MSTSRKHFHNDVSRATIKYLGHLEPDKVPLAHAAKDPYLNKRKMLMRAQQAAKKARALKKPSLGKITRDTVNRAVAAFLSAGGIIQKQEPQIVLARALRSARPMQAKYEAIPSGHQEWGDDLS